MVGHNAGKPLLAPGWARDQRNRQAPEIDPGPLGVNTKPENFNEGHRMFATNGIGAVGQSWAEYTILALYHVPQARPASQPVTINRKASRRNHRKKPL